MRKISDILKEERERRNESLSDISKATNIKLEYLKAIEEGKYHVLPSESYALGFVKNYAAYLHISSSKASALFKREFKEEKQEILPEFRKNQESFGGKNLFSIRSFPFIVISLIFAAYIIFQYSAVFLSPKLNILLPKNNEVINESVVHITGKTDQYATVAVDGDEVMVGLDGSFKKSLFLFPGERKITVIAKNRFGRQTQEIITVTVK